MANNTQPTTKPQPDPLAGILEACEGLRDRIRHLEAQVAALTAERDARDRQIGRLQAMLLRGDEFVRAWREMRDGFAPTVLGRGAGLGPAPYPVLEGDGDGEGRPERQPAVERDALGRRRRPPSPMKGKKRILYSDEDVAGWLRMWEDGATLEEISDVCHATVGTIQRRLQRAGADLSAPRGDAGADGEADRDGDEDEDDEVDEDAA